MSKILFNVFINDDEHRDFLYIIESYETIDNPNSQLPGLLQFETHCSDCIVEGEIHQVGIISLNLPFLVDTSGNLNFACTRIKLTENPNLKIQGFASTVFFVKGKDPAEWTQFSSITEPLNKALGFQIT